MQKKEPRATPEEFKKGVVRYQDVPLVELMPHAHSHIVSGKNVLVSFITMSANSSFALHRHEAEQIMIVVDGYCDEIIEGKLYRVQKGDVILLPPNIEHGAYVYEQPCSAIDIFSPPRQDYLDKLNKAIEAQANNRVCPACVFRAGPGPRLATTLLSPFCYNTGGKPAA
ncbi:MAG TPA: cupin domain-containing protein [Dehalococcoidia bacterium]|nr:cupin domain-containing protein [Dehalococcoidia bacterium]